MTRFTATTAANDSITITSTTDIVVFDSGVGGLSICKKITQRCPMQHIVYVSDNAAFPYGEKSAQEVITRASEVIHSAYLRFRPRIMVIACNTASTVVLPTVRAGLPIPVVGVVPAIKPAAELSESKTIALIATPGTVNRVYTTQLIAEFASDCKIISVGTSKLVRVIEQHICGEPLPQKILQDIIQECLKQDEQCTIDTAILGCTHFPLVIDQFRELQPRWSWVDSGDAIANRIAALLPDGDCDNPSPTQNIGVKTSHRADQSSSLPYSAVQPHRQHQFWQTASRAENTSFNHFLNTLGFSTPQILENG